MALPRYTLPVLPFVRGLRCPENVLMEYVDQAFLSREEPISNKEKERVFLASNDADVWVVSGLGSTRLAGAVLDDFDGNRWCFTAGGHGELLAQVPLDGSEPTDTTHMAVFVHTGEPETVDVAALVAAFRAVPRVNLRTLIVLCTGASMQGSCALVPNVQWAGQVVTMGGHAVYRLTTT